MRVTLLLLAACVGLTVTHDPNRISIVLWRQLRELLHGLPFRTRRVFNYGYASSYAGGGSHSWDSQFTVFPLFRVLKRATWLQEQQDRLMQEPTCALPLRPEPRGNSTAMAPRCLYDPSDPGPAGHWSDEYPPPRMPDDAVMVSQQRLPEVENDGLDIRNGSPRNSTVLITQVLEATLRLEHLEPPIDEAGGDYLYDLGVYENAMVFPRETDQDETIISFKLHMTHVWMPNVEVHRGPLGDFLIDGFRTTHNVGAGPTNEYTFLNPQENSREQDGSGYQQDGSGYEQDGSGDEQNGSRQEQDGSGYEQDGSGYEQDGPAYEQDGSGHQQNNMFTDSINQDTEFSGNSQEHEEEEITEQPEQITIEEQPEESTSEEMENTSELPEGVTALKSSRTEGDQHGVPAEPRQNTHTSSDRPEEDSETDTVAEAGAENTGRTHGQSLLTRLFGNPQQQKKRQWQTVFEFLVNPRH